MKIEGRAVTCKNIGDPVTYIPNHANGNANHKDAERGFISSFNNHYIWVKYNGSTGQNTPPENLVWG